MIDSPDASVLPRPAFRELPPGAVRPSGWLADQLRLQAAGQTGTLEELWDDVGPNSGWLGGTGEDWERGPYYLDGLIPLAHALEDDALLAKAQRWVEAILASQRPDGSFGPASNNHWWPRMVVLKALMQHADATGDSRVDDFMSRYFRYQESELPTRPFADEKIAQDRGTENVLAVAWLHARTGDPWLLEHGRVLLSQVTDWGAHFVEFPDREFTLAPYGLTHVVNIAMALKTEMLRYLFDGDASRRETTEIAFANLEKYHGLVHGMYSGDEHLAGRKPTQGVELCAVVELMFTLEQLLAVWGVADDADRLERIAYNLLPAGVTADMTAHQYHQQANQVLVSIARRDWTAADVDCNIFGFEPNYGCCTANMHQGWPKLLRAFWMTTDDGALAAVTHGPSSVRWDSGSGVVEIDVDTAYPFDEILRYSIRSAGPGRFPLALRVPGWCAAPALSVNGEPVDVPVVVPVVGGFLRIDREWAAGDVVELRLPATPVLIPRDNGATGVSLGPLVMVYCPGEVWERIDESRGLGDWEVRPRRSWGFGLAEDATTLAATRVERLGPEALPFGLRTAGPPVGIDGVPVKVWVRMFGVKDWDLEHNSAGPVPEVSDARHSGTAAFPLVPYGSARMRIAEFPRIDPTPAA